MLVEGGKRKRQDHVLVASTHEEKTFIARNSHSKLSKDIVLLQNLLNMARQFMESSDDLVSSLGERDAVFRQLEGHHQ